MASLKERLARLEARTGAEEPITVEIHILVIVVPGDVRQGSWERHPEDTPYPSTTFYAADAAEFNTLRAEYEVHH